MIENFSPIRNKVFSYGNVSSFHHNSHIINKIRKRVFNSFINLRKRLNLGLMAYYVGQFDMAKFDIACTTSILISAIYYLILHKDISTFCGIDYSTESGDERIKKTLKDIGHLIFIRHRIAQQREKFCDFLTEKGLTSEDIEHCKTMIF